MMYPHVRKMTDQLMIHHVHTLIHVTTALSLAVASQLTAKMNLKV